MIVKYEFATETVDLEVEEIWGEMLMDMDRREYNNDHKETRRHAPLYEMDQDDSLFPAKDNVEDEILRNEEMSELIGALEHLTPEQLWLVKKVHIENRPMTEIAIDEGVSEAAIRDRLKRIHEKMKKSLK